MVLRSPAPIATRPLSLEEIPAPEPRSGEIVVEVSVCGICRTDLHVVEGELEPRAPAIVPGHQVVGRVVRCAPDATRFAQGDRVGIAWLHRSCGSCDYCVSGAENLCRDPVFTGWHVHGGFAQQVRVPEAFAYAIPEVFADEEAAPLLCAGIIGYRALRRSRIESGGRLGLYGFGSSAHIAIQIARYWKCEVYVVTREAPHRALARRLGATWAGDLDEVPPVKLDSAIQFAPVGTLVPPALRSLRAGAPWPVRGST